VKFPSAGIRETACDNQVSVIEKFPLAGHNIAALDCFH